MAAPDTRDSLLGIAARDLTRLSQVTATLARHGFGALVGTAIVTDGAAETPGEPFRLAQGYRAGDFLFISGQAAIDGSGRIVG